MMWRVRRLEEFKRYQEFYFKEFVQAYRNRVIEFYREQYEKYPDAFPLMKPVLWISIFRNFEIITFITSASSDEFMDFEDFFDTREEYDKVKDLPEHIQDQRLLDLVGIKSYIEKITSWYGESEDPEPSFHSRPPIYQGSQLADSHFSKLMQTKHYDHFDINQILVKVNDENFQYELEEAVKAYNADLFLASSITSAVAIENLLKMKIIKEFGEKALPAPKDRYIINFANILASHGLMTERLYQRIRSANELRRGAGHSKSGKLTSEDAEYMLSVVKSIVEELF